MECKSQKMLINSNQTFLLGGGKMISVPLHFFVEFVYSVAFTILPQHYFVDVPRSACIRPGVSKLFCSRAT